ncbi:hypothetical protein BZA77DRAFT_297686 [Pyronema omphalodes]|nr:hypothetical protein BZA77DRAFT_297686 [Pyronema omphalodes]
MTDDSPASARHASVSSCPLCRFSPPLLSSQIIHRVHLYPTCHLARRSAMHKQDHRCWLASCQASLWLPYGEGGGGRHEFHELSRLDDRRRVRDSEMVANEEGWLWASDSIVKKPLTCRTSLSSASSSHIPPYFSSQQSENLAFVHRFSMLQKHGTLLWLAAQDRVCGTRWDEGGCYNQKRPGKLYNDSATTTIRTSCLAYRTRRLFSASLGYAPTGSSPVNWVALPGVQSFGAQSTNGVENSQQMELPASFRYIVLYIGYLSVLDIRDLKFEISKDPPKTNDCFKRNQT